jgi:ABC-type dipeptide/oligopeptide/nickel transport system permease component
MFTYVLRRLLLLFPTLIGVTAVVFFTMALSPGGVGAALTGAEGNMRPAEREALRKDLNRRYGLDKPIVVQYLRWLNAASPIGFRVNDDASLGPLAIKWPDLGQSMIRKRPVTAVVMEALPITVLLNLITIPIIYAIAITAGIKAAQRRGQAFDVGMGTAFVALWSLPTMWVGVMAIGFLANREYLQWFPTGGLHDTLASRMSYLPRLTDAGFERGYLLDMAWHLVLPIVCLTYGGFAVLSKLMRASVLENIAADFARTARAKGLPERVVLYRHVLRNSILPLITVAAGILPGLLGGSVIVESIFSIDGMGKLMIDAINTRDRDLILSVTLVSGLLSLLCLIAADVCYAIADPRVSYG